PLDGSDRGRRQWPRGGGGPAAPGTGARGSLAHHGHGPVVFSVPRTCKRNSRVPTYTPKPTDIQRAWHVVDADGLVLGRVATEVARILRGKHKPIFAPHVDTGDHVIVVNADKIVLTANKAEKKIVHRHSGYPGGLKEQTYADLLATKPTEAVRRSVRGMLPKNRLGRQMLSKLKVYAGPTHPHAAQQPQALVLEAARRRS